MLGVIIWSLCVVSAVAVLAIVKIHPVIKGIGLTFVFLYIAVCLPSLLPAKKRSQATRTLEDLRMINAAMDQYAIEFKKQPGDPISWNDIRLYFKEGAKIYSCQGKDMFGNPYLFKEVGTLPKISPETYSALSDVAPKEFWSPYY